MLERTDDRSVPETLKRDVPVFAGLDDEALTAALAVARTVRRARNQIVFQQGEPADSFYLILEGRLRVSQLTAKGEQVVIRFLGADDIAGCVAVCGGIPYPATATVAEDARMLVWTRSRIAELTERYPVIALNAMRIMGGRSSELQTQLRETHTERVERRIAHALARLVVQAGRRTPDGIAIDFPITRQEIAEMCGTTLSTVSRTLSAWEDRGIVGGGRQHVVIRDAEALARIADDEDS